MRSRRIQSPCQSKPHLSYPPGKQTIRRSRTKAWKKTHPAKADSRLKTGISLVNAPRFHQKPTYTTPSCFVTGQEDSPPGHIGTATGDPSSSSSSSKSQHSSLGFLSDFLLLISFWDFFFRLVCLILFLATSLGGTFRTLEGGNSRLERW